MSIAVELVLVWTRDPLALFVRAWPDDSSLRRVLLIDRLSRYFGKPVVALSQYLPRCVEITSEYRDELARLVLLDRINVLANAMMPDQNECFPLGPFPQFAYKDSSNRIREAMWRGAFAREDIVVRRVCVDIEERLRRENSGAE